MHATQVDLLDVEESRLKDPAFRMDTLYEKFI